ncbi:hypothetical protein [Agrobacterium sp. CG674]
MSDAEGEDKTKEGSGDGARLSDADFAEIRELYELGKSGITDLSETYGVSRQALSRRFKKAGVTRGSRAHEVAAATKTAVASAPSASTAAAIERFADKRADWIEETRLNGVAALKQASMIARKIVLDNLKAGNAMAVVDDDLKAVQRFNKILVDNIGAALNLLRANDHTDEEDLPSLTLEDLTNEEILNHHKATGAMPEDSTVEDMLAESADIEIEGLNG